MKLESTIGRIGMAAILAATCAWPAAVAQSGRGFA